MEGLTRLQEHRLELQHRLDMHRTMEMPPSPSPSSRSLAPFSSASSSLSEGSNQPSGEDSASIVTGIFMHTVGLFAIAASRGTWPLVCRDSREREREKESVCVYVCVCDRKKERKKVRERERERSSHDVTRREKEKKRKREKEGESERNSWVYLCILARLERRTITIRKWYTRRFGQADLSRRRRRGTTSLRDSIVNISSNSLCVHALVLVHGDFETAFSASDCCSTVVDESTRCMTRVRPIDEDQSANPLFPRGFCFSRQESRRYSLRRD